MISSLNIVYSKGDNPHTSNDVVFEQLQNITNNYVKHIDCVCLDEFEYGDRIKLMNTMVQKLSIAGTLHIKLINLDFLAKKINKGELTGEKYSTILPSIKSSWTDKEILTFIKPLPMTIKGFYYDDIYSILNLEKYA